ncbi:MAG: hypothetical protein HY320_08085 [Armatimonadetes bacterium]|nr:hypothetical protein [Armatimonadota bacterium]
MIGALTLIAGLWLFAPRTAYAHCDRMDGPVVTLAKMALEKGDVTPVLKWVNKEHEAEVRAAFGKTLVVRSKGPEARDLADRYFFEMLVRLHRAGEGAPYTGLKPASGEIEPAVAAADKALASGSVGPIEKLVTNAVAAGIRQRFAHALEKKKHADESVEAGREFVAAYVEFVHYVDRLYADAARLAAPHGEPEDAGSQAPHEH